MYCISVFWSPDPFSCPWASRTTLPNRFKPSPVNRFPPVNNSQEPYLKTSSYSFLSHSPHIPFQEIGNRPTQSLCSPLFKCELKQTDFPLPSSNLEDEHAFATVLFPLSQAIFLCDFLVTPSFTAPHKCIPPPPPSLLSRNSPDLRIQPANPSLQLFARKDWTREINNTPQYTTAQA